MVRVRNTSPEKRHDATSAYVGSLVGVSLAIYQVFLHQTKVYRVLIGCRNIHELYKKV
jgi:hypothetical protein